MAQPANRKPSQPRLPFSIARAIPIVLLLIGSVLISTQLLSSAIPYIKSLFIGVEYPVNYNFSGYDRLLRKYVQDGLVDYQGLVKDKGNLDHVLADLARNSPDRLPDKAQQLCFWVNTYNLLVIKTVVDFYPITSTKQIAQPLTIRSYMVGGKQYSLEEIQLLKLQPLINEYDPRAIFLICGGAVGDPQIQNHAIQPERLPEELAVAAYQFVNNPKNVEFDPDTNYFTLSLYLKRYSYLFEPTYKNAHHFANRYLAPEQKLTLEGSEITKAYRITFNPTLNDLALKQIIEEQP
jgi:hypothetical protein